MAMAELNLWTFRISRCRGSLGLSEFAANSFSRAVLAPRESGLSPIPVPLRSRLRTGCGTHQQVVNDPKL